MGVRHGSSRRRRDERSLMTVRWRDPGAALGLAHRSLVGLLAEVTLRPSARRLSSACRSDLEPPLARRRAGPALGMVRRAQWAAAQYAPQEERSFGVADL